MAPRPKDSQLRVVAVSDEISGEEALAVVVRKPQQDVSAQEIAAQSDLDTKRRALSQITGKDYPDGATDTIPAQNFVGPVNVIDCSAEVAKNPDFLLTVDHIKATGTHSAAVKLHADVEFPITLEIVAK